MGGVRRSSPRRAGALLAAAALSATAPTPGSEEPAPAWDNGVATTPRLGWNSYDPFNWNVTEAQVKANADYMRGNLGQHGWQYVVVDRAWCYPGRGTGGPNQGADLQPRLRTDANGLLLPDTTRFPSAAGTTGSSRRPTTSTPRA